MDWTTFVLGAIAGITLWNKLNPQVRELICSLFSQGECLLFAVASDTANSAKDKRTVHFDSVINRAFNDGESRRLPQVPQDMLEDADSLAKYLFYFMIGLLKAPKTPPAPSCPITRPQ